MLFDESLNIELHQEQMDFTVRYFKNNQVMTRYLSSAFLGHTTAEDLKLKFGEAIQNLDTEDGTSFKGWAQCQLESAEQNY